MTACAIDGCGRPVALPPCLDERGRAICDACALAAAAGRCAYCAGPFGIAEARALDFWDDHRSMLVKRHAGKPLCAACCTGLRSQLAGYRDSDSSAYRSRAHLATE